jgi:2-dehydro-3-deoxygluconokinase
VILRLMRQADIVFCSRHDAHLLFGVGGADEHVLDDGRSMTDARWVVTSRGSESVIAWCDGFTERRSATTIATVLDRIGAGDALAAGYLDGLLDGDARAGLARGTALAAHALSLRGDVATVSRDELLALADAQAPAWAQPTSSPSTGSTAWPT